MTSSTVHSRNSSKDSAASGASYQLILEHVFQKSGTYEIPLRTMYAINCSPGFQRREQLGSIATSAPPTTTVSPTTSNPQQPPISPATAQFTSALIDHITKLPTQPCSLPAPFITTFLRRCFCEDLTLVDFPQALTGLDYLKDLETRRRRAIESAFTKLGLQRDPVDADQIKAQTPSVVAWVKTLTDSERKVEALYTQLYIGLRRWILINELELTPFNKYNCLAMLNTLYTPICTGQPTASLTPQVMRQQRDGFFKYIQAVEQCGTVVLDKLMQHGKRPGDENGWTAVRNTLDAYLRVANSLIDDCSQVTSLEDVGRRTSASSKRSKADSGISFGSNTSHGGTSRGEEAMTRSNPVLSTIPAPHNGSPMWQFSRGFSKLERIASELRKMKNSRQKTTTPSVMSEANKENINVKYSSTQLKRPADDSDIPKVLEQEKKRDNRGGAIRKLRSLGDLRSSASRSALRSQSRDSSDTRDTRPSAAEPFDVEEMRRKRMIWEATTQRAQDEKSRRECERQGQEVPLEAKQETVRKVQSEHTESAVRTPSEGNGGNISIPSIATTG